MKFCCVACREGRLSTFLRQELRLSTGFIRGLKSRNAMFVNGEARHTNHMVHPGDRIEIIIEEDPPHYPAEFLPFSILYEDAYLLIVDKPPGILVHPSPHQMTGTLANRVIAYYQQTAQPYAFHPVTRLDRDTFGIVLIAKSAPIHEQLIQLHSQGKLRKTYHALVYGRPPSDFGRIDAPIARRPWPSLLREVSSSGQSASTLYHVLDRYDRCSLLELQPITGRTHQLRLHCAWSGFPILGDPQYNTEESLFFSETENLSTQQLQAFQLEFPHPVTGAILQPISQMVLPFRYKNPMDPL